MMINRELLQKLRDGKCTRQELADLQQSFAQSELNSISELLNEDWELSGKIEDPELIKTAELAQTRVWVNLLDVAEDEALHDRPVKKLHTSRFRWYAAASVLLVSLLAGGWMLKSRFTAPGVVSVASGNKMDAWIKKENRSESKISLRLADGSTVALAPKSEFWYPVKFQGKTREVRLMGAAFFDVHKDSLHPFTIRTADIQVVVLGTSFNVRENREQKITEVDVVTGKVMIGSAGLKNRLYLNPNEKGIVNKNNGLLTKTLVEAPDVIDPKPLLKMEFSDTPVSEIFTRLQSAYGVEIVFDKNELGTCPVTARLNDQPLFVKLDMICGSIGADYYLDGSRIIIQGSGCANLQSK